MNKSEIISNVTRAIEGEQSAITTLYNYTYPSMYRLVLDLCGSHETAEDILQESYIKAFRNLKKLSVKAQFYSWLRIIVVNTWLTYARHIKAQMNEVSLEDLDDEIFVSAGEVYEKSELDEENERLWQAVNRLPDNQRVCVILFYYQEMSVEDIAKALDIPTGSVKSRLYYARQKLKDELGSDSLFYGLSAAVIQGGASQSLLTSILEALAENGAAQTVASGIKWGLMSKIAVGIVSVGLVTGGAYRLTSQRLRKGDDIVKKPAVSLSDNITTTSTTAASLSTSSATTTQTTIKPTTTTAFIPSYFGYREMSDGVEIISWSGDDDNVVIPSRIDGKLVVSIGSNAFGGSDIKSIDIPGSVRSINDNAFRNCKGLALLRLHEGLEKIGDMAFLGCEALTEINIPESVKDVGIYSFAYCKKLRAVVLNEGIKKVGYCAFYDCERLEAVTLPESLEDIGNNTFSGTSDSLILRVKDGTYSHNYGISGGFNVEIF